MLVRFSHCHLLVLKLFFPFLRFENQSTFCKRQWARKANWDSVPGDIGALHFKAVIIAGVTEELCHATN